MHGGLSPDLNSMEQIRRVMRPTDVSFTFCLSHIPFLGPPVRYRESRVSRVFSIDASRQYSAGLRKAQGFDLLTDIDS